MMKILCLAIIFCICGTNLFAQTETNLPPLSPPSQKQRPVLSLDIPISPLWDTVQEDRIKNHTIQFGGSATPWKNTAMFGGWPVPRIIFAASSFRMSAEGGVMKVVDLSPSRTMKQVHVVLEGSVWYVLFGTDRFFGQEQIQRVAKSVNFETDFRRLSYGWQYWLGVKVGDFNRSFIAGRYGRGDVKTEGLIHFNVPDIDDLDWFPLYHEEFRTTSLSVEGKVKAKFISQSVRLDQVEYERVILSPDPLRFGENHLEDRWLRSETEVTPFSSFRVLRGVVILTKDFRGQNRLMFVNDYSSVRVLLRLSFN